MKRSIVNIDSLGHRYSRAWAIKDINIIIDRKGIYGLLGSNGAGKSTTMNILCGALNQKMGTVTIGGVDIREEPIQAKMKLGYLPQIAPLYLDLTIEEYLIYCAQLRRVDGSKVKQAVKEVMEKCGITHVKSRLLKNLSGGYRQRAGIAQAIIHKPELVILDEPTNGLDPLQIIEVRNLIKDIAKDCTVILSSHILSEIQQMCDHIIMIEQGKMVFCDTIQAFNNYLVPQSMIVELENAPDIESLCEIPGVENAEQLADNQFRLYYNGKKGVSELVVETSVAKGWRLSELTVEKKSVDEIFKQLTKVASNK